MFRVTLYYAGLNRLGIGSFLCQDGVDLRKRLGWLPVETAQDDFLNLRQAFLELAQRGRPICATELK